MIPGNSSLLSAGSAAPLARKSDTLLGMDFDGFQNSLAGGAPPGELDFALTGLWWDAKGDWVKAHEAAQQDEGARGSWVHAYLHRKEGDPANAAYWYRRAGRSPVYGPLADEWCEIARALLAAHGKTGCAS